MDIMPGTVDALRCIMYIIDAVDFSYLRRSGMS